MNKVSYSFQFLINLSNTYLSLVSSLEGYINAMAHEQINVLMRSCERLTMYSQTFISRQKSRGGTQSPVEGQIKSRESRHSKTNPSPR